MSDNVILYGPYYTSHIAIFYGPYTKHLFLEYFAEAEYRSVTLAKINLISDKLKTLQNLHFFKTRIFWYLRIFIESECFWVAPVF